MIIKSKHDGYVRGIRRVHADFGGDSGGGTATQTTVSDVAPWAKPFAKEQLGAASSLVFQRDASGNITGFQPYQQYTGERSSQFTPLQQQAFQSAGQQGVAGQIGQATGLAGAAAQQALSTGAGFNPYQTGQFGGVASSYMDPYMQNVVAIQQREAQRQADIAGTQRAGEAVKAGAFGGGRQAVIEAEAARNLGTQMGDIQARGLQDAYARAQQQFNTEQALAEQSRQYGAELGIRGASAALQGAQTLGGLGQTQFGQQMDITQQQAALGGTQQQQMQAILDRQYQDFMAQQQHPYSQLDWLTAQLRGIPMGSQQQVYTPQPSPLSQVAGIGTLAAGLARAEGGVIPSYADGGITGLLSDQQLQQRAQSPTVSELAKMAVQKELMDRAAVRQGVAPQQAAPQTTVAEEVASGLAALDVDPMGMAGGGIVAFQAGGSTELGSLLAARERYVAAGSDTSGIDAAIRAMQERQQGGLMQAYKPRPTTAPVRYSDRSYDPEITTSETARRTAAAARSGIAQAAPEAATPQEKAPPPGSIPAVAVPRAAPAGGVTPSGIAGYLGQLEQATGFKDYESKTRADQAAINKAQLDAAAEGERALEEDIAARGTLGAEREKRIAAQEARAKEGEDKNLKMTLIEAGLAIMGGQSPNALTNIAAGAASGLKGYQARLDKAEAEKQRLDEARAALEDARRLESIATGKERRDAKAATRTAKTDVLKSGAALTQTLYGVKADMAKTAFESAFKADESAKQRASSERMVGMQVAAYGGRGGAGGAGGSLAAQKEQRLLLSAQLSSVQRELGQYKNAYSTEAKQKRAELEGQAATLRAALAKLGPDTGAAPAAPVNSGGTTRIRFDAQGNMIQ